MITCPHCAHQWTPAKPARPRAIVTSTEDLSVTQLYAVYRKSAPLEDVRFFKRTAICSPELQQYVEALETEIINGTLTQPAQIYRRLTVLQDAWRAAQYWQLVVRPAERLAQRLATARTLQRTA
jgi:hypothetical protein